MQAMIVLPILAGLVTGVLVNLFADAVARSRQAADTPPGSPAERRVPGVPACAACDRPRPLLAWSGLLAWLTGHRRCPSCTFPLSWRHVLVESALIVLYAAIWAPFDVGARTGAAIPNLFYSIYGAILIAVLVTDLEHRLVPHAMMLPAIGTAGLAAFINPAWDSPVRAMLGGALGLLCGLGLYGGGVLFVRLLGRMRGEPIDEIAFGFGDVTLLTFIGLIVGAPAILLAAAIGVLCGGLFALLLLILRGLGRKQYTLWTTFPYAPFLILGASIMLIFGRQVMAWYFRGM